MPHQVARWAEIAEQYHRGTIVLGNGASIAVSRRFAYGSLLDHAQQDGLLTEDVGRLFDFFGTQDFELVLRLVWQATTVNKSLQIPDERTRAAYLHVRDCLIEAVRAVHPEHGEVQAHLPLMYQFLKSFDTVLSLNYDLLVYWTMTFGLNVDDRHTFKDCFLRHARFDDDWQKYRELYKEKTNTLVFYPHGSLALCRDAVEQEFKVHAGGGRLLEAILDEWRSERVVPLFVSEGTKTQKVSSIQNSYYLSTVYREVLTSQRQALTLFGWGIGEHDRHLLQRMRNSGIQRVAVSVLGNDQVYCNYAYQTIQDDLGPVQVDFFDCESPGCWIHPMPEQV
ncbi:hypothetical protein J3A72_001446 [Stenotrophomonas sp. PvP093]|uniref:DUF4917 family protein n=1 Tax=Stenotrophomonas TaxID=40323 RepID=UPI0007B30BD1|nr:MULTISPECIES: DUF4917 family protein [Stenotrophomonas]KZE53899.1 hypothetical protein AVW14_08985 [Stenotrophomonas maltophilia]TGR53718.1 DUF4917 family protein [bacterium M00.F.Ca.ET.199.01.1.1]TGT07581.1 DUF4917 family protein [bacterium M00.F.Ca.ET.177.01.1.1]TGT64829.1 DUF4917 family protein [Mesorhizobium sp. M00.F.Ca.ET.170.01.1.1]TGU14974.1 DUF4917 family protein [bacterium M00.F.Ca.ET.163.01.1.1]TGU97685.1 DUF4917 family protein [Mesorhizobium sp. M00.F.Ca.ET.151.01.1.1]TGV59384